MLRIRTKYVVWSDNSKLMMVFILSQHLLSRIFRTFKASNSDDGTLIKVALDRSGIYADTLCTDKTVAIYDYYTGECMATMFGHSELVTGIRFTEDCKHLISVSGESQLGVVWSHKSQIQSALVTNTIPLVTNTRSLVTD